MKNLGQMMKQAQQMQAKMAELQAQLAAETMTGAAGGGMVEVTMNGKGEMTAVKIDKSLVQPDDVEVLEDLIVAAAKDAKQRRRSVRGGARGCWGWREGEGQGKGACARVPR